ncbi:MAG: TolC family protein [Bacteroidales bacterium]|jgi:outer membrane protein TolC|nr:TolC family protein [Bacteroidales bacterium]
MIKKKSFVVLFLTFFCWCQNQGRAQFQSDSVSISLNTAIEIALSENPTMKIAGRNIEIKKNYKKEQIAAIFPDVYLQGSLNRTLLKQKMVMEMGGNSTEITVGTDNQMSAGLAFSLPIVAPALWYNVKLSSLDVELSMNNARSSRVSMINEVKKAYFNYLLSKDSYDVLMVNYQNAEMNYKNIKNKYEQGLASEFEKLRAEVDMKNQLPNINSTRQAIHLSGMLLRVLLGISPEEKVKFTGQLSDFEQEMLNTTIPDASGVSLSRNPDLAQLDLAMQQLRVSNTLIISGSTPSLALAGAYQSNIMFNDKKYNDDLWSPYSYIALSLKIPLVSWAGTIFKLKSNKLNIANLEDQRQYLEANLRVSVVNAINLLHTSYDELNSNKETMLLAEKAYSIARKQYDVGLGTWLDLNSAEVALTGARLKYRQSIYNYLSAKADLDKITGDEQYK